MPNGIPLGAMCVQRFDDSRDSAIHITYHISLRSSSMQEPRDPLLKVLFHIFFIYQTRFKIAFLYWLSTDTLIKPLDFKMDERAKYYREYYKDSITLYTGLVEATWR